MALWVGEDYKNNNEMCVEVADMMEDAICWGHYLADVVRALVRDNRRSKLSGQTVTCCRRLSMAYMSGCAKEFQFMKTWPR